MFTLRESTVISTSESNVKHTRAFSCGTHKNAVHNTSQRSQAIAMKTETEVSLNN